jgi:carbon-monoxide dehydrogenase medium subunit
VKPAPFAYHDVGSVAEAVDLLCRFNNARVIAGGQSLMPMLNLRAVTVDHLIDLGKVPELAGIELDGSAIMIGAMTTQRSLQRSDIIASHCPLMIEALYHVGHQQTRNRGTIGGSLCHLDPAAELPVVAMASDAIVTAQGKDGVRSIPFSRFPTGILTSCLEPDEVLTHIRIPSSKGKGWAFEEIALRPGDFAIVAVAILIMTDEAGRITDSAVAFGGLGSGPFRAKAVEAALSGRTLDEGSVTAAQAIVAALPAESDLHTSARYKKRAASVLFERAARRAYQRSGMSRG